MSTENSVDIVHAFWDEVWNAHDPAAVDRFVTDDFFIVSGGETVSGRENFKKWIEGFLAQLTPAPAGHRVVRERRR
jgi:ketosteroid isomerase-like protein